MSVGTSAIPLAMALRLEGIPITLVGNMCATGTKACAIVTTPEIAKGLGKSDVVTIKALQLSLSAGRESAQRAEHHRSP